MILQRIYKIVLNTLFKFTEDIPEAVRYSVMVSCCSLLTAVYFFPKAVSFNIVEKTLFGTAIVLIMIAASVNQRMEIIEWDKKIYLPMVILGIWILFSGQFHSIGGTSVVLALSLIFIYPCFYYIWINRGDYITLCDIVFVSTFIVGVFECFFCLYLAMNGDSKIVGGRLSGNHVNPNATGVVAAAVVVSSLYLLYRLRERIIGIIVVSVGLGASIGLIIECASRTAMLAALFVVIVLIAFVFKRFLVKRNYKKLILCTVTVVFVVVCVVGLFSKMDELQAANMTVTEEAGNEAPVAETTGDGTTEAVASDTETVEIAERIIEPDIEGDIRTKLNRYSSGRTGIWEAYIKQLNWVGHAPSVKDRPVPNRSHNVVIEYSYRYGITAGLLFGIWFLLLSVRALKLMFSKESTSEHELATVMMVAAYFVYSMLEVVELPYTYEMSVLFYLMIGPLFEKRKLRLK